MTSWIKQKYIKRNIESFNMIQNNKDNTNNIHNTFINTNTTIQNPIQNPILKSNKYIYDRNTCINDDEYISSLFRIEEFNKVESVITFIIPTKGRDSLINTIKSIITQTLNQWQCIIIFDNCFPNKEILDIINNDNRFLYIIIKKHGEQKNGAGNIRNIGMSLVNSKWIGFVDDDDTLDKEYINYFYSELIKSPSNTDCIIFRMNDLEKNITIPPYNIDFNNIFTKGNVGISFCYKKELFNNGYYFEPSDIEDLNLLIKIKNNNKKIIISKYITYYVKPNIT